MTYRDEAHEPDFDFPEEYEDRVGDYYPEVTPGDLAALEVWLRDYDQPV